jgi:3-oxoacyl-[acyl-carrier protein] reductase
MAENKLKTAIVTGSTQGIGLAIAHGLAGARFRVGINGRNNSRVEEICSSNDIFFNAASNANDIDSLRAVETHVVEMYDYLDLLVCNIGGGKPNSNLTPEEEWERVFKLNLYASMNTASIFSRILRPGTGKIIFISSIAGHHNVDAPVAYGAAKLALNDFSKQLARDLAPQGICVNTLLLGNMMFKGSTWEEKMSTQPEQVQKYIKQKVPLNAFGSTEEVSRWCIFLSGDEIKFTTGALIPIDGGQIL